MTRAVDKLSNFINSLPYLWYHLAYIRVIVKFNAKGSQGGKFSKIQPLPDPDARSALTYRFSESDTKWTVKNILYLR